MIVLSVFSRDSVTQSVIESHNALMDATYRVVVLNHVPLHLRSVLMERFGKRNTTFIETPYTLPIARAYNVGLSLVPESLDVLELQDDVVVPDNMVSRLCDSGYDVPAAWGIRREWCEWCECFSGRFAVANLPYSYVDGKCLLLRSYVRQRLGFHNELFFKGVDADWGIRASAMGMTVGHLPEPYITDVGYSTAVGSDEQVKRLHDHARIMAEFLHANGLLARRYESMCNDWRQCTMTHGDGFAECVDGI